MNHGIHGKQLKAKGSVQWADSEADFFFFLFFLGTLSWLEACGALTERLVMVWNSEE